jgi:hypothetical protein
LNIDFSFICDYADVTGKINALGIGFDTIYSPRVPCKHPSFFLVVQVRASTVESGEKNLRVNLIDEDGKDVIPAITGKFTIPKPASGMESVGRIAMRFNNVEFPRYGDYSLHAVIEGHEMVRVPLKVIQPPVPATPPS